jgi:hypothetical protein
MSVGAMRLSRLILLGIAMLLWKHGDQRAFAQSMNEYQVKAAYLYNFAKFIQWPPEAFANDQSPLFLCIVGADPFGQPLDGIAQGKMINGRALIVRRTTNLDDLKACQIVFSGSGDKKRLSDLLRRLKGSSALAVGESRDFTGMGGSIQFYLEDDRIRFSINVDALQRAHLTASSKLLALAKIVHDQEPSNGE